MTELELMELSQPLADIYMAMEEDLMVEIARRIAVSGEVIPTSEWRLKKLAEAGALNKKTIEIIAKYTGLQAETLTETIEAAAYGAIKDLEPAFQKVAEQGIISSAEVPASETTKRVVKNFRSQAASDLNLVNTVMQYKSREAYKALVNKTYKTVQAVENAKNRQELLNVLGKHTLSVVTGGESRQAAVRKCIEEFSEKGIPAFVDKAGREWSPEAYINMDIKTTVSNTARTAQEARFDEYGIDLIQVSSHNGARPKCAKDQGKLYSRSNKSGTAYDGDGNPIEFFPFSQTSFGQPDGLFGINCHHKEYAFISGVNFQRYFPYDEEENAAQYKKIQNQRRLERRVRETKRNIAMLKEVGDTEGVKLAKKTLAQRNKAYNDYCAENNLKPHSDRLAVVNAKAVKNAVKDIDNSGGSGIIKAEKSDEFNIDTLTSIWDKVKAVVKLPSTNSLSKTEVEMALKEIGFASVDDSFNQKIHSELQASIIDQLKTLEDRFGAIKKSVQPSIAADGTGYAVGSVSRTHNKPLEQSLHFSKTKLKSKKKYLREMQENIDTHFCMPCNTDDETLSRYVVAHEYGHMLENSIIGEEMKGKFGTFAEFARHYRKQINDIAKTLDDNYSESKYISDYGSGKDTEFFAECFANSQLGQPNVLGKAIEIWLERRGF